MKMLRTAGQDDFNFIRQVLTKSTDSELRAQIKEGRYRIVEHDGRLVGFLRFYVLWDTLPFVEMIHLVESARNKKFGTQAVRAWEKEMEALGYDLVLISTGSDARAQIFGENWATAIVDRSWCGTNPPNYSCLVR